MAIDCHNTPGLPKQTRRQFFASALAAVAAVPAAASATTADTPVMRKYREWEAARAAANGAPAEMPDEEHGALVSAQIAIEDELITIPAENAQDFIAKAMAYTAEGWNGMPSNIEMPELWAEAKRLIGE